MDKLSVTILDRFTFDKAQILDILKTDKNLKYTTKDIEYILNEIYDITINLGNRTISVGFHIENPIDILTDINSVRFYLNSTVTEIKPIYFFIVDLFRLFTVEKYNKLQDSFNN